jgi:uncharacterized caspase-like protein
VSGQRKALIIANDAYTHRALRDLGAPGADAEALSQVLSDPQIGDFSVRVVRNESAHVIAAEVEDICSESRPDDLLLVHFSGHGLKSESGELFFAAANTRPDRLRPEAAELASTALPAALDHPLGAAAGLVNFALDCGGLDNVTVVLIPFPPRYDE